MDKEVLVSISGLQFEASAVGQEELEFTLNKEDAIEAIAPGEYFFRNGKHYVLYEEITEEGNESAISKNMLKLSSDRVELTKKGITNVSMCFEKGKKDISYYETPYGSLVIGIHTTQLTVDVQEDLGILAVINYSLDINYNHVSDCTIKIKIVNRN